MKKFLAVMMIAIVGFTAFAGGSSEEAPLNKLEQIKAAGKITYAVSPDFAPLEFVDLTKSGPDALVGCEIAMAKYIADYIGVDLEIQQMDFATCQASVAMGKVDFSLSGYAYTPERAENMGLTDEYVFIVNEKGQVEQGAVVLAENVDKYKTAEDFAGGTYAAQNGSLQYNLAMEQLPKDIKIEQISSMNDGMLMLMNGKVDGVISATDTALEYVKNYPQLAVPEFRFDFKENGNVGLVNKNDVELLEVINEAIHQAEKEGLLKEWYLEAKEACANMGIQSLV